MARSTIRQMECDLDAAILRLPERDGKFVKGILAGMTGTQAWAASRKPTKARPRKTATAADAAAASRKLKDVKVTAALRLHRRVELARYNVTPQRIVDELAAVAFTGLADVASWLTNESGELVLRVKSSGAVGKAGAAIASLQPGKAGAAIKLGDKIRALEALAKLAGMYEAAPPPNDKYKDMSLEQLTQALRSKLAETPAAKG